MENIKSRRSCWRLGRGNWDAISALEASQVVLGAPNASFRNSEPQGKMCAWKNRKGHKPLATNKRDCAGPADADQPF